MELILLIVIAVLMIVLLVLSLTKGNNQTQAEQLQIALRQQMQENREELNRSIRELRMEMTQTLNQNMQQLQDVLHKNMMTTGELQRQKFDMMARQQEALLKSTEKRLDDMRLMVEEKLQKTLNERIGQSFEIVRSQLENVQKGLGEMKSLAQDVGGLKKVLSNVKMRGTFGEVQLGALLEQMMSPEQYDANVKTKKSGTEFVEFAIKLPGKDDANSTVYLPIDAKFPKDVYEQYYDAFEAGDAALMESSGKQLENTIKKMAKDIHDKYVDPPFTTDFAIMFLPFESIYAEVIRRTSLIETLQKEYKIVVTGPTTLAPSSTVSRWDSAHLLSKNVPEKSGPYWELSKQNSVNSEDYLKKYKRTCKAPVTNSKKSWENEHVPSNANCGKWNSCHTKKAKRFSLLT